MQEPDWNSESEGGLPPPASSPVALGQLTNAIVLRLRGGLPRVSVRGVRDRPWEEEVGRPRE